MKRHAVPVYFALVFVISWGGGLLILGPGDFPPSAEQFESLGALLYIAILAGPCLSGILLIAVVDGRRGLRDLLARLGRWRVGWNAYALALLPALVMTATALLLSLVSADSRPVLIDSNDKGAIVMRALLPAVMVGFFEEIGWTGFAVPHLRARHSILATGLAVGVVWGAWHLPLFWESDSFSATLPLAILVTRLFSWLPAFRVLLVWMYDRTRSLPVVMFMHTAVSFVSLALQPPEAMTGARLLIGLLVSAAMMWLLLALWYAGSRRASRLTT